MKGLNKKSKGVFIKLTELLNADGYVRITVPYMMDLIMKVKERSAETSLGSMSVYQMAHYYQQAGKLIPDPEMVFVCVDQRTATNHDLKLFSVYPESFKNSSSSLSSGVDGSGNGKYSAFEYDKMCAIGNQWFGDIVRQGFLSEGVVVIDKNYPF